MTPEEAQWVRDNAWTEQMRRQPVWLPGTSTATYDKAEALARCDCQVGMCFHCRTDRHWACHAKRPDLMGRPQPEDFLADVPVWYADRTCRSLCPCPCPRTMTPREAEWVRSQVWSAAMRKTFREVPAFRTSCPCLSGPCQRCQAGQHDKCDRREPLPCVETFITDRSERVVYFAEPYQHPTFSATGAHHTRAAQVWLADRRCRYLCPCPDPCHAKPVLVQDTLFDLSASM